MFQGLRTTIYHVDDIEAAKAWYTTILGIEPYFDEFFYVGFNIGGYELGLQPRDETASPSTDASVTPSAGATANAKASAPTVVAYWGVANARESLKRVLELGATLHQDVQDVGDGILVATVTDPSGNHFGIIENPHFSLKAE